MKNLAKKWQKFGFFGHFCRKFGKKWDFFFNLAEIWPKNGKFGRNLVKKWKIWPKNGKFGRKMENLAEIWKISFILGGIHSFKMEIIHFEAKIYEKSTISKKILMFLSKILHFCFKFLKLLPFFPQNHEILQKNGDF